MIRAPGLHVSAVNLAVANACIFDGRSRYVTTITPPGATAVFSLYGVVTYNGLVDVADDGARRICLAPFDAGLSHALAVLRYLGEEPYFYVRSTHGGISISTGQLHCEHRSISLIMEGQRLKVGLACPGDDFSVFRPILMRDAPGQCTRCRYWSYPCS